jgi:D-alanyl-D-alanine carboxypeptidase (penicillin-binding protein 5/6)
MFKKCKQRAKSGTALLLSLILCVSFSFTFFSVSDRTQAVTGEDLTARAAVAICFETGEDIFAYNADLRQAPASMVKMMTVYLAFEGIETGLFTPDCVVPVSALAEGISRDDGQTNVPLNRARQYTVMELLDIIVVVSAGGATVALAEFIGDGSLYAFYQLANDKVDEWGIDAYFQAPHGGTLPTFMSPRAMAVLVRNTIQRFPQVLDITGAAAVEFHGRRYTSAIAGLYPGMDGFKTGSNNTARFNFAGTAARGDTRVITVVMGSATSASRFADTAKLLDYSFYITGEYDE